MAKMYEVSMVVEVGFVVTVEAEDEMEAEENARFEINLNEGEVLDVNFDSVVLVDEEW